MPGHKFQKGQSGNPSGRPKSFLSKAVKEDQFLKSFRKLIAIRDGFIKQLDIQYDDEGKPVEVYGVANIKELVNACKLIMAYTGGLPVQQIELPPATGPVKINILLGNQIYVGDANGSQLRPDLKRRLLDGQPGTIMLGQQVAEGFNEDVHVAPNRIDPIRGEPFFIGQDFGHTPTTIIGQESRGRIFVYAAITCEHGGVRQHLTNSVIPWFTRRAPWALRDSGMILGGYDPSGNTEEQADTDQSPILVLEELLPGFWEEGAVSWEGRKGPMLAVFNRAVGGRLALQIDPVDAFPLVKALRGGWYYPKDRLGNVSKDLPKKPNHPHEDLGDAFCYFIGRISPSMPRVELEPFKPDWGKFDARQPAFSGYDVRRRGW
jgi:hypothetical protein